MPLIFGFDIGTTSVGFAVIDHDSSAATGKIERLGVRIYPEARDPKGIPLNQERRRARLRRRQLRRRRQRLRSLHDMLREAGLLPARGSREWEILMKSDPYCLRKRAVEGESLSPHEIGRAFYHLAKRRHFRGRELEDAHTTEPDNRKDDDAADEKRTKAGRDSTLKALEEEKLTLGAWLAKRGPHERKRSVHATRAVVEAEFEKMWDKQAALSDLPWKDSIREAIFAQRPVFWRKNALGECRFLPGKRLCLRGAWLSQQRRMLEKVNNLAVVGGNARPLDDDERRAILDRLQTQASMTWGGVRRSLAPVFRARSEPGAERSLKFNLEVGGDRHLIGNAVEARLAAVFGVGWSEHPRRQDIRDAVPERLWTADYDDTVGAQRVVIRSAAERKTNRARAARSFIDDFDVTGEQAEALADMKLPTGWEPYSIAALRAILPHLEAGVRFGALVNGPDWAAWRDETFPDRERPTGEIMDRLPSPADLEESRRLAKLRNPTVVRTHNELRKVVNNLIDMFGKPDLIHVELAREVGKSKREREEMTSGIRARERRRDAAKEGLAERGFVNPSRDYIDKWMLWEESGKCCPYTGDCISFDALFHDSEFNVEHIWPRSRSLDNSFRNKTLCRRDENLKKSNRTPYEYLHEDGDRWAAVKSRLDGMMAAKGGIGMSPGKVRRFLASSMPDDFAARQLNDTSYSARDAVAFLERLWPNQGPVRAVSGRVTAQLRRFWGLNNILAEDGEKTRADHRHHAIDALTVACAHSGIIQRLTRYWQGKEAGAAKPRLEPPWATIRDDAEKAVAGVIVSHRVRKKVSGPLHKETVYGDTGEDEVGSDGTYHLFVTRKKVEELSKRELEDIRDGQVQDIVRDWVEKRGGNPKKAFPPYPKRGRKGPEIRKVRLWKKQKLDLMARVATGYTDLGNNHHMAIYMRPDGKPDFDVVSLFEASRRLARREPVVRRDRDDGATFVMSLAPGDVIEFGKGKEKGLWVLHGVSSAGRPTLARINDARPTTASEAGKRGMDGRRKDFEPRFGGLMQRRPRKLSIDPIGRIRLAND